MHVNGVAVCFQLADSVKLQFLQRIAGVLRPEDIFLTGAGRRAERACLFMHLVRRVTDVVEGHDVRDFEVFLVAGGAVFIRNGRVFDRHSLYFHVDIQVAVGVRGDLGQVGHVRTGKGFHRRYGFRSQRVDRNPVDGGLTGTVYTADRVCIVRVRLGQGIDGHRVVLIGQKANGVATAAGQLGIEEFRAVRLDGFGSRGLEIIQQNRHSCYSPCNF